jgi:HEAT repeat protein
MPWLPTILVRLLASRQALGAALVAGAMGLSGCAAMDDFSWKKMNFDVFTSVKNPLEVIKSTSDCNLRARAIRELKEPSATYGSQQEQDLYVAVLNHLAATDGDPLCRMAAVRMLRTYKDPRAVNGLKEAYYRAGSFHNEQATVIRRLALDALGEAGDKSAIVLLLQVLNEPPTEGPDQDRDAKLQERMAAARALAHFDDTKARAALVAAMAPKEDIALQRVAHESLVSSTGVNLPQEKTAWEEYMRDPAGTAARAPRPIPGSQIIQAVWWR